MSINVEKGQALGHAELLQAAGGQTPSKLRIDISWQFKDGQSALLDASALLLSKDQLMPAPDALVYFNQASYQDGALRHEGAQTDGGEQIVVDLAQLPQEVKSLVITLSSSPFPEAPESPVRLGVLDRVFLKVFDAGADGAEPLCVHELAMDLQPWNAVVLGKLYRDGEGWGFEAPGRGIGEAKTPNGLAIILRKYSLPFKQGDRSGIDLERKAVASETPAPDAQPETIKAAQSKPEYSTPRAAPPRKPVPIAPATPAPASRKRSRLWWWILAALAALGISFATLRTCAVEQETEPVVTQSHYQG
jgi:stress response protein SCP2